jgi:hypothetical protein
MFAYRYPRHGLKSPTGYPRSGWRGFRGPTPPQLPCHPIATAFKSPSIGGRGTRRCGSGASPHPNHLYPTQEKAVPGEEEEELNQKNEPTYRQLHQRTNTPTHNPTLPIRGPHPAMTPAAHTPSFHPVVRPQPPTAPHPTSERPPRGPAGIYRLLSHSREESTDGTRPHPP